MPSIMQPKIIFEDDDLLVIDKPAGMVVNRADTTAGSETVQDWVEQRSGVKKRPLKNETAEIAEETDFYKRAGIVHRLDKETSGLLLIAKTPEAFENLQAQFKNRQVKKKYLALVHGRVIPEQGEIKAPVGRLPWNRERFGVLPGGREAVTKYKVIANYRLLAADYSLLELAPETGRTHQIRVHLKYLGFPIVGDEFYAGRKQAKEDRKFCPRVFLQAGYLSFAHPRIGKKLEFTSSLAPELEDVLINLL